MAGGLPPSLCTNRGQSEAGVIGVRGVVAFVSHIHCRPLARTVESGEGRLK